MKRLAIAADLLRANVAHWLRLLDFHTAPTCLEKVKKHG